MKKAVLMMVAVMITSLNFAQKTQEKESNQLPEKDVPNQVKSAFQKKCPNVKKVKWEKDGQNYEAGYDLNKIENTILFDASGNLLQTEVEIDLKQLPKGVSEYVKTNYKGEKVKEAEKITDVKGVVTYEAEIKGMDLLFDNNGKFIKAKKD